MKHCTINGLVFYHYFYYYFFKGRVTCTSFLKRHIERCPCKKAAVSILQSTRPSKMSKQVDTNDSDKLKNLLTKWVASGFNSFRATEHQCLKDLVQFGVEIGFKYQSNVCIENFWPGRKNIKEDAVKKAENFKEYAKKTIENCKETSCMSITTDMWSDGVVRNSYIDVSVFYVEDFTMKHQLIAFRHFPESHTADNILAKVGEIADEFKFDHMVVPYVTDSGVDIKAAFKNSGWYACLCHRLHTIISDAWSKTLEEDPEIRLTFEKMMNVRRTVKMSNDLGSKLPRKLPNDSPTRMWTGLSAFFSAFNDSFDTIAELFSERNVDAPTDKKLIETVSSALQEFDFAFKGMQAANLPTLHLAVINVAKLNKAI